MTRVVIAPGARAVLCRSPYQVVESSAERPLRGEMSAHGLFEIVAVRLDDGRDVLVSRAVCTEAP